MFICTLTEVIVSTLLEFCCLACHLQLAHMWLFIVVNLQNVLSQQTGHMSPLVGSTATVPVVSSSFGVSNLFEYIFTFSIFSV